MKLWDSKFWIFFSYPLSLIYKVLIRLRNVFYQKSIFRSYSLPVKVISVGNITVGGTGKTPLVCMIARILHEENYRVGVLSRGYGRQNTSTVIVSDGKSILTSCRDAGDEPYLMANKLPYITVTVGRDRYRAGAVTLESYKREVFLMDDGFQHRRLKRSFDIVTMDAQNPWGNGHLLPSGPLREPLISLKRAKAVVLTGPQKNHPAFETIRTIQKYTSSPIYQCYHQPAHWILLNNRKTYPLESLSGKQVLGFAGIARPESFQHTLKSLNVTIPKLISFQDHHWYTENDVHQIVKAFRTLNVDAIVTTEKDGVRLNPKLFGKTPLFALAIELNFGSKAEKFRKHLLSVFHT